MQTSKLAVLASSALAAAIAAAMMARMPPAEEHVCVCAACCDSRCVPAYVRFDRPRAGTLRRSIYIPRSPSARGVSCRAHVRACGLRERERERVESREVAWETTRVAENGERAGCPAQRCESVCADCCVPGGPRRRAVEGPHHVARAGKLAEPVPSARWTRSYGYLYPDQIVACWLDFAHTHTVYI